METLVTITIQITLTLTALNKMSGDPSLISDLAVVITPPAASETKSLCLAVKTDVRSSPCKSLQISNGKSLSSPADLLNA